LSTIALIGITIDLNVNSRRTNASPRTNANTIGARDRLVLLKSTFPAVSPVTATFAPPSLPTVSGMTRPRSTSSACTDVASFPFPTSGMSIFATVRARLTDVRMGCFMTPDASAALRMSATAAFTRGAVTSGASTTTVAGDEAPGKAFWIVPYVWTIFRSCGRSLKPSSLVCMPNAGSASTTRNAAERAAAAAG